MTLIAILFAAAGALFSPIHGGTVTPYDVIGPVGEGPHAVAPPTVGGGTVTTNDVIGPIGE